MTNLKEGWEFERKHIFILSSSGKPIFSRYGDEQDFVTTFGLLQAVISIALDSGDTLRCIRAGDRIIVFLLRGPLYFIAMSSTNEPEVILLKQLDFLYQQILLVLTSKVNKVFENNPSSDIRQLLGPDTTRLMHAACEEELVPTTVAFEAIESIILDSDTRKDTTNYLKSCVEKSGAALGILLWGNRLVGYKPNPNTQLNLGTPDVLLLIHFVTKSNSLCTNDQHWVPLCMPGFNEGGYLQAYISNFQISDSCDNDTPMQASFKLVLMASSADPDIFKELMRGKRYLEKSLQQQEMAPRLLWPLQQPHNNNLDMYLESSRSLHFLYKLRPAPPPKSYYSETEPTAPPAQFLQTTMRFPIDQTTTQQSIWTNYQRLAITIRRGACTVESTLFPLSEGSASTTTGPNVNSKRFNISVGGSSSEKQTESDDILSLFSCKLPTKGDSNGTSNKSRATSMNFSTFSAASSDEHDSANERDHRDHSNTKDLAENAVEEGLHIMSSQPASDHALAYTVLASGFIVVALATYDSELFVTFPGMVSPLDACTTADILSRTLKNDSANLFQTLV